MASVATSFFSGWGAPSKAEGEWSNTLAEAQHLLRDIAIDFQDRDARSRRGADGARLTAGLRRRVWGTGFKPAPPVLPPLSRPACTRAPAAHPAPYPELQSAAWLPRSACCAPSPALNTRLRVSPLTPDSLETRGTLSPLAWHRKLNTMTERLDRLELELLPELQLCVSCLYAAPSARHSPPPCPVSLPLLSAAHSRVPGEAAKRREVLFRMRKELELLNARLSGAQTGMDRCVRVAIHGAMYHLACVYAYGHSPTRTWDAGHHYLVLPMGVGLALAAEAHWRLQPTWPGGRTRRRSARRAWTTGACCCSSAASCNVRAREVGAIGDARCQCAHAARHSR
jgi:hypothetical protein